MAGLELLFPIIFSNRSGYCLFSSPATAKSISDRVLFCVYSFFPISVRQCFPIKSESLGISSLRSSPIASSTRWSSKRIANAPLEVINPSFDKAHGKSSFIAPCSKTLRFTIEFNDSIYACVSNLITLRSPSAIGRVVITIVINTVKRMFWSWLPSHVSKEVIVNHPSFANVYSSSSVSVKPRVLCSATPINHSIPSNVLRFSKFSVLCSSALNARLFHSFAFCPSKLTAFAS